MAVMFLEWEEAHPPQPATPPRLIAMWRTYGKEPEQTCGQCIYLTGIRPGQNTYFKCRKARITHGPGTDWRKKWTACALFKVKDGRKPPSRRELSPDGIENTDDVDVLIQE